MRSTLNKPNKLAGLIGLITATAVTILPVSAIENPAAEGAAEAENNNRAAPPKEARKKVAMLGLGGAPSTDTLALHLGLERGNGLTIYHVIPGSAAAKAGLAPHDVITGFQDKKIGSQQDLRVAVHNQEPGDQVSVKYIRKGKAEEIKVILGERNELLEHEQPEANPLRLRDILGNFGEADLERMEQHMEQMRKRLQQNGGIQLELQNLLDGKLNGINKGIVDQMKMNMGASVTMLDQEGSITMKNTNGKKEVLVKDKAGKVVFEGPYQTEQDKAAVPDDIRDRLKHLNFDENRGNLLFGIEPRNAKPPINEPQDGDVQ